MQVFTPTEFRANSSNVFNQVQADGEVLIQSKGRPNMVIMLESEKATLVEKIRQLTEAVKAK